MKHKTKTTDCFPHLTWIERQRLYAFEKLDYFSNQNQNKNETETKNPKNY